MQKFRTIPAAGRVIIVVCALGVFAIAFVSCWTSYNAIYRLVSDLGLYGKKTNTVFPLMLDAAFLVAELAAALGVIMHRVTNSDEVYPTWPVLLMILCGVCTIVFNVAHAYLISDGGWANPTARVRGAVSALPPVLMILSFQVLIAIVKWVMLRLGRPEQAFGGVAPAGMMFGIPNGSAQMTAPMHPYWSASSEGTPELGQNGHGPDGGEDPGEGQTIAAQIDGHLDVLGTELAGDLGARKIRDQLQRRGVDTSERWVKDRMNMRGIVSVSRNGKGHA